MIDEVVSTAIHVTYTDSGNSNTWREISQLFSAISTYMHQIIKKFVPKYR